MSAVNSALGTVCGPKKFQLAPEIGACGPAMTHAHPHLRNLGSLVFFPPDPSIKTIIVLIRITITIRIRIIIMIRIIIRTIIMIL